MPEDPGIRGGRIMGAGKVSRYALGGAERLDRKQTYHVLRSTVFVGRGAGFISKTGFGSIEVSAKDRMDPRSSDERG